MDSRRGLPFIAVAKYFLVAACVAVAALWTTSGRTQTPSENRST